MSLRDRLTRLEQKAERAVLMPLPVTWHVGDHGDRWSIAGPALGFRPGVLPLVAILPGGREIEGHELAVHGLM